LSSVISTNPLTDALITVVNLLHTYLVLPRISDFENFDYPRLRTLASFYRRLVHVQPTAVQLADSQLIHPSDRTVTADGFYASDIGPIHATVRMFSAVRDQALSFRASQRQSGATRPTEEAARHEALCAHTLNQFLHLLWRQPTPPTTDAVTSSSTSHQPPPGGNDGQDESDSNSPPPPQ
jgi:hypothetical protein